MPVQIHINVAESLLLKNLKPLGALIVLLSSKDILEVLDKAAQDCRFPMLDNGYIYLAASRMSLFRSSAHWALVFEIFGYSPRVGDPDLSIFTIASQLHNRDKPTDYVSIEAYQSYHMNNPNTEMRGFWPISNDGWIDEDNPETVVFQGEIELRGRVLNIPINSDYGAEAIELESNRPAVYELCRFLASRYRNDILALESERRVSILPDMKEVLSLDDWHHPDLAIGQAPSETETFRQIASVLANNDSKLFLNTEAPNNHWSNWPEGGTL